MAFDRFCFFFLCAFALFFFPSFALFFFALPFFFPFPCFFLGAPPFGPLARLAPLRLTAFAGFGLFAGAALVFAFFDDSGLARFLFGPGVRIGATPATQQQETADRQHSR